MHLGLLMLGYECFYRGAKRFRRYGLAGIVNLLSSGSAFYPLSDGHP